MADRQITRVNHYVPIWYQKGFIVEPTASVYYLDLNPPSKELPSGRIVGGRDVNRYAPSRCFCTEDLYTVQLGETLNDEVEKYLFGTIDDKGAKAVRAFSSNNLPEIHKHFQAFFEYLDAQKLRTPKGLEWIRSKYQGLNQLGLMLEMQGLRQMHCTMWSESVREIVSAESSDVKFIVTDHPITVYNAACPPTSSACQYPDDPAIELKGTQTVFALDADHCLVLSNLEYANNPDGVDLMTPRTNARYRGQSLVRTDALIRTRKLTRDEVITINFLLKSRARKYIAAGKKEWLYPEKSHSANWGEIRKVLLPTDELWQFGGETFIRYEDGHTRYQDAFGRTSSVHKYLQKEPQKGKLGPNDLCGCGSGKKYKKCCDALLLEHRPSWNIYSIRERNLILLRAIKRILGLNAGKTWDDVRRELSDEQVKHIHEVFSDLWPIDTAIVDLLPRPDQRNFRAIYLGIVDPRTVALNVTSWLAYFDEIIVPNPFLNDAYIKPEFSPTASPEQYKSQTLKNVLSLLILEPFIAAGYVHLIPDPCDFNEEFRRTVWKMAEERTASSKFDMADAGFASQMAKDDFRRSMSGLPEDDLRRMVVRTSPKLSSSKIELVVAHLKAQHESDPCALLQPMMPGRGHGQVQMIKGFNLEVALFLAELTGSAIYTDAQIHWQHLHAHTSAFSNQQLTSVWTPLSQEIKKICFLLDPSPTCCIHIRKGGALGSTRHLFRRIANSLLNKTEELNDENFIKQLTNELQKAEESIRKGWASLSATNLSDMRFQGHIEMSFPAEGFYRDAVRRLLLTFGRANTIRTMPLAMFVKVEKPSDQLEN